MHAKTIAGGLALALVAVSAPAAAAGPPADAGPPDDTGFPGLPDPAMFGICTAHENADENATAAPPFQWLMGLTGACEDVEHPGEQADDEADEAEAEDDEDAEDEERGGPPEHAGPP
jgi:uncharacterized membrane protein